MAKYRKTAFVEARQVDYSGGVETLEGYQNFGPGDYICTGIMGEEWPVQKAIFEATYELVKEDR